jgi:hypothetical protein
MARMCFGLQDWQQGLLLVSKAAILVLMAATPAWKKL